MTICSENTAFGRALRILLLEELDVVLVSRLSDVNENTDVVVCQIDHGASDATLRSVASSTPTLALGDPEFLIDYIEADCRGFLPDTTPLDEIRQAVLRLIEGHAVIPPDLLGTVLKHLVDRRRRTIASLGLDRLTDREREVFWLAAKGARKEEIGEALFMSPATARTHLQRLYRKLGVHSQAELIALASADSRERDGHE